MKVLINKLCLFKAINKKDIYNCLNNFPKFFKARYNKNNFK